MALTQVELKKLKTQCDKLEDGPDYRTDDYVTNLLNTVLDFQMHVGPVASAMNHYEQTHGYKRCGNGLAEPNECQSLFYSRPVIKANPSKRGAWSRCQGGE